MYNYKGQIVQATAGRDRGNLFCVMDVKEEQLLLADGKRRKAARPKAKNPRHVREIAVQQNVDAPAIQKLKQGATVSDRELRRALAAFKEGNTLGER